MMFSEAIRPLDLCLLPTGLMMFARSRRLKLLNNLLALFYCTLLYYVLIRALIAPLNLATISSAAFFVTLIISHHCLRLQRRKFQLIFREMNCLLDQSAKALIRRRCYCLVAILLIVYALAAYFSLLGDHVYTFYTGLPKQALSKATRRAIIVFHATYGIQATYLHAAAKLFAYLIQFSLHQIDLLSFESVARTVAKVSAIERKLISDQQMQRKANVVYGKLLVSRMRIRLMKQRFDDLYNLIGSCWLMHVFCLTIVTMIYIQTLSEKNVILSMALITVTDGLAPIAALLYSYSNFEDDIKLRSSVLVYDIYQSFHVD